MEFRFIYYIDMSSKIICKILIDHLYQFHGGLVKESKMKDDQNLGFFKNKQIVYLSLLDFLFNSNVKICLENFACLKFSYYNYSFMISRM